MNEVRRGVADERGDVILSGLLKTLLVVGLVILVLYEFGAVVVNNFQVDDYAQQAARAGARVLGEGGREPAVQQAVAGALNPSLTLDAVVVGTDFVTVTATRPARVLIIDRMGPLERFADTTVTVTSRPAAGL